MSRFRFNRVVTVPLVAITVFALILGSTPFKALGQESPSRLTAQIAVPTTPLPIDPTIDGAWRAVDGANLGGAIQRPWVWGPAPLAMTVDHVPGVGERRSAWFDKGRIDINDPNGDRSSIWYAAGAPLVTELLAGAIRINEQIWVARDDALIPVAGDMDQPSPVTYATLGTLATLPTAASAGVGPSEQAIGSRVTTLLEPSGTLLLDGVSQATVTIGAYDTVAGHNVAQPFVDWMVTLGDAALPTVGQALTEPYWIDTVIGGENRRVLVQAFERRVLSFDPAQPGPWQVESANSGVHYRLWRGLQRPEDARLDALASTIPFGEEIVAAATASGQDPFLLAAIAKVMSDGNPLADPGSGHRGLLGVRGEINDPAANASAAAAILAGLSAGSPDTRSMLARYYAGNGDVTSSPAIAFVDAVMATQSALVTTFGTPVAFTVSPGDATLGLAPGYDEAWWARSLSWYTSWGGALENAEASAGGYYCALDGAVPGDRVRVSSGDQSIECIVGARVGVAGLPGNPGGILVSPAAATALGVEPGTSVGVNRPVQPEVVPIPEPAAQSAAFRASGPAAYYDPDYDRAWWDRTVGLHASWGNAVAGWQVDPNGYYCVHPDFAPGQRLRLSANGVTLDCTIGDSVRLEDQAMWRSRWAVELSWDTFQALGLAANNSVEVFALR